MHGGAGASPNIAHFENMAQAIISSPDPKIRTEAQRQLTALKDAPQNAIPQCMAVLGGSAQPYALMAAAATLSDLVTKHWKRFNGAQALGVRDGAVQALFGPRGPQIPGYVRTALAELAARVTQLLRGGGGTA